ncbi:DUF4359 domain-containing protein, partial [Bacillus sp. JJ1773]|uniref:DUF4359 domain-containing protein n=1 Tax=Bacillus sp. JJ1773 TaxID=3122965 RepID=UPI002FFF8A34
SNSEWLNIGVDWFGDKVLENTTNPRDYVIFSIYKTSIMNNHVKTLGIFKTFIPISSNIVEGKEIQLPDQSVQPVVSTKTTEEDSEIDIGSTDFNKMPFILINDKRSPNLTYWGPEKLLEQAEQAVKFNDRSGTLTYGRDTPNGFKFRIILDDYPVNLFLEDYDYEIFDDLGEIPQDYTIQASTYDFDNDGNEEVIITIGDGFPHGKFWVFGYSSVKNVDEINPMRLLLTEYFQSKLILSDNVIMVPIGSQGLFEEYIFTNNKFYFSNNL